MEPQKATSKPLSRLWVTGLLRVSCLRCLEGTPWGVFGNHPCVRQTRLTNDVETARTDEDLKVFAERVSGLIEELEHLMVFGQRAGGDAAHPKRAHHEFGIL